MELAAVSNVSMATFKRLKQAHHRKKWMPTRSRVSEGDSRLEHVDDLYKVWHVVLVALIAQDDVNVSILECMSTAAVE